jgi:SCY1-like protein 1
LQNLHTFAHHLTPQLVEKEIYPAVSSGFTDSVPGLRELSLMSMVHLVPKLSEKVINSQVCR